MQQVRESVKVLFPISKAIGATNPKIIPSPINTYAIIFKFYLSLQNYLINKNEFMKKFILLAPILLIGCNINIKKYNPNEVIVIVELRINKDKSEDEIKTFTKKYKS